MWRDFSHLRAIFVEILKKKPDHCAKRSGSIDAPAMPEKAA
jgi:hypothetical protein